VAVNNLVVPPLDLVGGGGLGAHSPLHAPRMHPDSEGLPEEHAALQAALAEERGRRKRAEVALMALEEDGCRPDPGDWWREVRIQELEKDLRALRTRAECEEHAREEHEKEARRAREEAQEATAEVARLGGLWDAMQESVQSACASRDAAYAEFERLEGEVARLSRALEVEEDYTASKVAAWRRRHWGMEDEVRRLERLLEKEEGRARCLEDRVATAKAELRVERSLLMAEYRAADRTHAAAELRSRTAAGVDEGFDYGAAAPPEDQSPVLGVSAAPSEAGGVAAGVKSVSWGGDVPAGRDPTPEKHARRPGDPAQHDGDPSAQDDDARGKTGHVTAEAGAAAAASPEGASAETPSKTAVLGVGTVAGATGSTAAAEAGPLEEDGVAQKVEGAAEA